MTKHINKSAVRNSGCNNNVTLLWKEEEMMHTPYSVGLDRLFAEMNRENITNQSNYPPYNILKLDGHQTLLELAVAGFKESDLSVEFAEDVLKISGKKDNPENNEQYMHKGIGMRSFRRQFVLSPDVKIIGVSLEDGILKILLDREIPEHKKPRQIPIGKHLEADTDVNDEKLLLQEER